MSASPLDLLPPHLGARAVLHNARPCQAAQPFVLYWMRVAMRGHDNPALAAALHIARHFERPLVVYQGLSERYPFASDRHHRFILEGARDVQAELAACGIAYAFHLERPGHRGDHLLTLAARSVAVVTEIFPWRPLAGLTARVAERTAACVMGLDTSCLVPMPQVAAESCDRAFRFRSDLEQARAAALAEPGDAPPRSGNVAPALPDLPFTPVDFERLDLGALIAACAIDHGVAPVAHTPGGSRAGYARWAGFRDQRLHGYDRRRNDPLADGVSRLSPYLHYGQVSPFRIAREAAARDGNGAAKFLDELLIWRELSWAWCFHHPEHETLGALPDWARATLDAHREDPRPALHDLETLARGRTGDPLWDAAQHSLLIHGELHNNVRMTWGKMLAQWAATPEAALAALIDLNHRYALDGRDPSSYGGLLWCLGLFDRPFDPPRPVLGRIRGRDTAHHARRLDVATYAARIGRAAIARPPRVAVVGAGIAGLTAARTLLDHGLEVEVYDKGRRAGGRYALRTTRSAPGLCWEHGAPAFEASDPRFLRSLEAWEARGRVAVWQPNGAERPLWVATPTAAALGEHLAADLTLALDWEVERIERRDGAWWLHGALGTRGPFEALALNMPPAQASRLLHGSGCAALERLAIALAGVPMLPCWAAMLVTDEGAQAVFDRLRPDSGPVALAVREAAKPGRTDRGCFTFNATPEFSQAHLEASPAEVAELLAPAIERLLGTAVAAEALSCHRWRFARPVAERPPIAAHHPDVGLYLCGDWLSAEGGIEGAYLSGIAAAGRLLGDPPNGPPPPAPSGQQALF